MSLGVSGCPGGVPQPRGSPGTAEGQPRDTEGQARDIEGQARDTEGQARDIEEQIVLVSFCCRGHLAQPCHESCQVFSQACHENR